MERHRGSPGEGEDLGGGGRSAFAGAALPRLQTRGSRTAGERARPHLKRARSRPSARGQVDPAGPWPGSPCRRGRQLRTRRPCRCGGGARAERGNKRRRDAVTKALGELHALSTRAARAAPRTSSARAPCGYQPCGYEPGVESGSATTVAGSATITLDDNGGTSGGMIYLEPATSVGVIAQIVDCATQPGP